MNALSCRSEVLSITTDVLPVGDGAVAAEGPPSDAVVVTVNQHAQLLSTLRGQWADADEDPAFVAASWLVCGSTAWRPGWW